MHRRPLFRILFALLVVLVTIPAVAAPRDKAATKKIDEAINQHYFATAFDKAEAILLGTIKACEDKCSPEVLGRAWMYVGIVRGSGKADMQGAKEAFLNAVALDPKIKLDDAIANDPTKVAWGEIAGTTPTPPDKPTGTDPPDGGEERPDAAGDMECSLEVREVQTRRAIPIECMSEEDPRKAELRYKAFGSEKWEKLKMRKSGDGFRATIPCEATMLSGELKFYVRASDSDGVVDQFGKKSEPIVVKIVGKTDNDPPAYPDKDEPDRCEETVTCPPDFPGCGAGGAAEPTRPTRGGSGWGSTCEEDIECEAGLACRAGSCEEGQSCDADPECTDGLCIEGTCARGVAEGGGGGGPTGPYKKFWVGVHGAQDLAFLSGDQVCSNESLEGGEWACFHKGNDPRAEFAGQEYALAPAPQFGGGLNGGSRIGTTRILLSFDYAALDNLTVGLRAGYALGGNPSDFLPVHAEVRGAFWPLGSPRKGFKPYLHFGGGLAQVDASIEVTVRDCGSVFANDFDPNVNDPTIYPDDSNPVRPVRRNYLDPNDPVGTVTEDFRQCFNGTSPRPVDEYGALRLNAYKKLGQQFVTFGGGMYFGIIQEFGVLLNVNAMIMFPTTGFVLEPSLGIMYGF